MPRINRAPDVDTRTTEEMAQIEAARERARVQAANMKRDRTTGRLLSKSPLPDRDDQASDVDATPTAAAISLGNTGVSEIIITSDKPERRGAKPGPKPEKRQAAKKASRRDVARVARKAVAITKRMGAPTYYQQENITAILDAIAAGDSLTKACQQLGIPWKTVWNWRTRHPDFRAAYERAVQERAHAQAEQVLDIADDDTNDVIERVSPKGKEQVVMNTAAIQRARLKIQARQWSMAKALPDRYGDLKTIRDERHPLDLMSEEQLMQATIELVEKVKARLDQARALGLLPPKTTDAEYEDVSDEG
jgi:hypothetical protein